MVLSWLMQRGFFLMINHSSEWQNMFVISKDNGLPQGIVSAE